MKFIQLNGTVYWQYFCKVHGTDVVRNFVTKSPLPTVSCKRMNIRKCKSFFNYRFNTGHIYRYASLNDGDTFWEAWRSAISSLCERILTQT